jgi:hypothetical protein
MELQCQVQSPHSRRSCRLNDTCGAVNPTKLPFRVQSLFRDVDTSDPKAIKRLKANLPQKYELLSCSPNVYLIHKFLSEKEIAHILTVSCGDISVHRVRCPYLLQLWVHLLCSVV